MGIVMSLLESEQFGPIMQLHKQYALPLLSFVKKRASLFRNKQGDNWVPVYVNNGLHDKKTFFKNKLVM